MAYLRKTTIPQEDDQQVLHFPLQGLLPEGQAVALCIRWGTLSLLALQNSHPSILSQEQFTTSEVCVLIPLMEYYPYYCPLEVLFSSVQHGNVSEASVAKSRDYLRSAKSTGLWDQEMRPIRNGISRARLKLRAFGIEITLLHETGYVLMPKELKMEGRPIVDQFKVLDH